MGKIELQNICFQYAGNSSMTLENINLSVNAGEFVCVLGTSGCGKSTLLSILCGLQRPSSGKFLIDGKEITGPGPERGVVFQHYSLFPWLTAKENIIFGIKQVRKDLPKKEIENIAQAYMAKVGLEGFRIAICTWESFHIKCDLSACAGRPLADFRRLGEQSDCFENTV